MCLSALLHKIREGPKFCRNPNICNNVEIGPDSLVCAKIIQDNVIIKADTIVGKNIPANVVITGNPGKIIHRNSNTYCGSQRE